MFSNVPRQLAASGDGSVQRFRFRNAIERKRRYRELRGPIDWLEAAKLVRKCYPVKGRPSVPLWAQARPNIFKLYLFDVGLLGHMLGLTYADQRAQDFTFKGYVAENFVQSLRLAGRGEKIHEKVCRYGGRVPIREVWRARAMTAAVRRVLGLSETLGTCASSASNETRRS